MALAVLAKIALGAASGGGKVAAGGVGTGTVAKGVAIGQATLDVAKKMSRSLTELSGHLKASLNLLSKSFKLMLKPIADVMGLLIRPLALQLLRFAIPFYKAFAKSNLLSGLAKPEDQRTAEEKLAVTTGKAGLASLLPGGGGGLASVGKSLLTSSDPKGIISAALDKVKELGSTILGWLAPIGDWIGAFFTESIPAGFAKISEWLSTFFGETLPGWFNTVWAWLSGFFTETLPSWFTDTWETLKEFFLVTLPGWFTNGWEAVKTFITITVPEWFTKSWDTVKTFVTETIPGWFSGLFSSINSWINNIKRKLTSLLGGSNGGAGGSFAHGGFIQQSGTHTLHAGEFVLRAGQVQQLIDKGGPGANMTFAPNIHIAATINNQMDVRVLARQLAEIQETEMRRMVSF